MSEKNIQIKRRKHNWWDEKYNNAIQKRHKAWLTKINERNLRIPRRINHN